MHSTQSLCCKRCRTPALRCATFRSKKGWPAWQSRWQPRRCSAGTLRSSLPQLHSTGWRCSATAYLRNRMHLRSSRMSSTSSRCLPENICCTRLGPVKMSVIA
ncbi:unnamed protein product [Symbiodinium microadriaticum]|nr:unnamed protein product [Symbiodinium microadriaticum]